MKMGNKIKMVLAGLTAAVMLVGCNGTVEEVQKSDAVNVELEDMISQRFVQEKEFTGSMKYGAEIPVMAKYVAKVTKIYVTTGQKVSKGQALANLSTTDYESQFDQAKDGYNAVVKGIGDLNKQIKKLDKSKKKLKKQLKQLMDAKTALTKQMVALPEGTPMDAINAQMEKIDKGIEKLNEAMAGVQASRAQLLASRKSMNQQKKTAKSGVDSVNKMRSDFVLRAPISGYIGSIGVKVDNFATQQAPAFTIVSKAEAIAEIMLTESEINQVKKGQKAVVKANSKKMKGKVLSVNLVPDQMTQMYACQVKVPNPAGGIKSGMIAEVSIQTVDKDAKLARKDAVLLEAPNAFVFIVEGDKAKKTKVKLGLENDEYYEILGGVQEGDSIVVKGQDYLEDGTAVKVVGGN